MVDLFRINYSPASIMSTAIQTVAVSTILLGIAFLFVALRCYCRLIVVRSFGFDDILLVLAFLSSVGLTVFVFEERVFGLGQDINTLTLPSLSGFLKSFWATIVCYCLSLTAVKDSALLQCLRFILLGKMRIFCWVLFASNTVFGLMSALINIFHCNPVQGFWDLTMPNAKCIDLTGYWYFASAFVITTDILVVLVPVLTVKDMNLPFRQKVALIIVFALGGFACVASIVRVHALVLLGQSPNVTRNNTDAAMWSSIEINIGIICVCIPPLKPIVSAIAPSLLGSRFQDLSNPESEMSGNTLVVRRTHSQPNWPDIELDFITEDKISERKSQQKPVVM